MIDVGGWWGVDRVVWELSGCTINIYNFVDQPEAPRARCRRRSQTGTKNVEASLTSVVDEVYSILIPASLDYVGLEVA